MNFIELIAHAGEAHETSTETLTHSILNEWWAALSIYIAILIILVTVTYFATKKSTTAAFSMLLSALLVGGIAMYSISPIVSIFALTTGFTVALGSVFLGIRSS